MYGQKPFGDDGHRDLEPLGDAILRAGEGGSGNGGQARPARPARQRVELLNEEAWLKRQLADWDDFDDIDVEDARHADRSDGADSHTVG